MTNTNEIIEFMNASINNVNLRNVNADVNEFHAIIRKVIDDAGITSNIDNIVATTPKADIASCIAGLCDNIEASLNERGVSTSGITLMTTVIAGVLSATLNKYCAA